MAAGWTIVLLELLSVPQLPKAVFSKRSLIVLHLSIATTSWRHRAVEDAGMPDSPPSSARNVLNISADLSCCNGLAMGRCTMSLPAGITGYDQVEKERPLPWKRAFAGREAGCVQPPISLTSIQRFSLKERAMAWTLRSIPMPCSKVMMFACSPSVAAISSRHSITFRSLKPRP